MKDAMNKVGRHKIQVSSPHVRRPEPPSQEHDDLAESAESRVCPGTPGIAQQPLTQHGPGQNVTETVAQGDGCGDGPHVRRLESLSKPRLKGRQKRRRVKIDLPFDSAAEIEAIADRSGLARSQFLPSALMLGVRQLARQLERASQSSQE